MTAVDQRPAAPTRHPLAEVQRLRAELDELHRLVAAFVAADPGPTVTVAEAGRWAADAAAAAYEAGHTAGYLQGVADLKHAQLGIVGDFRDELARWHVCCGECRRASRDRRSCVTRSEGCPRCEVRTRETFGLPHPDDYRPEASA